MWLRDNLRQRMPLVYLAVMRIAIGYHFLTVGWPNVPAPLGYAEVAIGISLLAGLLTRLGALAAAVHSLNVYLFATVSAVIGMSRLMIVLNLAFVAAAAGRSAGVDAWLHRRFPRSPIF